MRESVLFTYFLKDTENPLPSISFLSVIFFFMKIYRNGKFYFYRFTALLAGYPFRHFPDDADCFVIEFFIRRRTNDLNIT